MKTKYFTLFAILAAVATCINDVYSMLSQSATQQTAAQANARILIIVILLLVNYAGMSTFFTGLVLGEKRWTKLRSLSLVGAIVSFLTFVFYLILGIGVLNNNTNLQNLVTTLYLDKVPPMYSFYIPAFLLVLLMSDFKNKLLTIALSVTFGFTIFYTNVINTLNYTVNPAGPDFAYVLVKTTFIPDLFLLVTFIVMFMALNMADKADEPVVEADELEPEDIIVDDYEVEGDEEELDGQPIETISESEEEVQSETSDETDK